MLEMTVGDIGADSTPYMGILHPSLGTPLPSADHCRSRCAALSLVEGLLRRGLPLPQWHRLQLTSITHNSQSITIQSSVMFNLLV